MKIPSLTVIGDPSANLAGFWDPVTSLVDWCEENYIKNYFIGEFWNTLSNLGYLFLFLYALFYSKIRDVHTKIFTVSILFLSIGSALFHATLSYGCQMIDESQMIVIVLNMLFEA
uniref:Alkaline ceramidase n=1 Tax=Myxobolus squamalis TaxID=59785 RepID=A0A6B2FZE6_MYXSQ